MLRSAGANLPEALARLYVVELEGVRQSQKTIEESQRALEQADLVLLGSKERSPPRTGSLCAERSHKPVEGKLAWELKGLAVVVMC